MFRFVSELLKVSLPFLKILMVETKSLVDSFKAILVKIFCGGISYTILTNIALIMESVILHSLRMRKISCTADVVEVTGAIAITSTRFDKQFKT